MKQTNPELLAALDAAWDDETGFLGRLRYRHFDAALGRAYVDLVQSIEVDEGEPFSPDFIRLLWFVPLFLEWRQRDMAEDRDLADISDLVRERVMELLGTP
jgi:hypothetical protein